MKKQSGFVLLNALIMVAAMSAAIVFVIARTETARALQEIDQTTVQKRLYLDAYDALALQLISEDLQFGETDHADDNWAQANLTVDLDRGEVSGSIVDLQSKFNVNWLVLADTYDAEAAFRDIASRANLAPSVVEAIIGYVRAGGADQAGAYSSKAIPIAPRAGPLVSVWQLREAAGMTDDEFTKLRKYVSVYPVEQPLNINTAPREVIEAMVLGSPRGLGALLASRGSSPMTSLAPFHDLLAQVYSGNKELADAQLKFALGSNTFLVESAAQLNGRLMRRETIIQRSGSPRRAQIALTIGPL